MNTLTDRLAASLRECRALLAVLGPPAGAEAARADTAARAVLAEYDRLPGLGDMAADLGDAERAIAEIDGPESDLCRATHRARLQAIELLHAGEAVIAAPALSIDEVNAQARLITATTDARGGASR